MKAILQHMDIYLHNTKSGEKEKFVPNIENNVSIYNCGPTIYDSVHVGNLRAFVMADILRRIFEYNDYKVNQVMNLTDIDDKTIKASREQGISLHELTKHFEKVFIDDIHALNIQTPHKLLRATDHIDEMIKMILKLIEYDIAYTSKDGVYFSIAKFANYGDLAKLKIKATDITTLKERINNDEYEKENPRDFALWKFYTENDGNVFYNTPFGRGRPGWSIECSAMAIKSLGESIDIHTGGIDLVFPHHTNEIAQSEAYTGKKFVNYWVHNEHININDQKMAKSKNNFLKLADLIDQGISPIAFRYWLLTSHYRSKINLSIEAIKGAQTAYIKLVEIFMRLHEVEHEHVHAVLNSKDYSAEFHKCINDDMNTAGAIALVWEMIKDHSIESKDKIAMLLDFDKVLGLGLNAVSEMRKSGEMHKQKIPDEIIALAEARQEARKNKEWDKADALRKEISERGYEVKDTESGFEII